MKHENRFVWFDLIRGMSALAVCAGHLRAAMIVDLGGDRNPGGLHKLFYFSTGLGHQAVVVFFVLSGFFVGGSILKKRAAFPWGQYALARLTRLWIVLIPSLLLTAGADLLISSLDPHVLMGSYESLWHSGPPGPDGFSDSLPTFLGNIVFLQTLGVPVFGTNAPLWSLANEFWYYVLFPCLMCIFVAPLPAYRLPARLGFGLLSMGLLVWLPGHMRLGFLIWIFGVLVWLSSSLRFPKYSRLFVVFGGCLFLGALLYTKSESAQISLRIPADLTVAIGFAILAASLAGKSLPAGLPRLCAQLPRALADFSYSLYVIHFPAVLLIAVIFYRTGKVQPDAMGLLQFAFWLAALIALGIAFWWCFEKRTDAVRRWLTH